MGLALPATPLTDGFRNHPVHQPLRTPILPRHYQPTDQTPRSLRRRSGRAHHLPSNPRPNGQRVTSAHPLKPLPFPSRNQHLPPLLLPQRHLRLSHNRPLCPRTRQESILYGNNPPRHSHHHHSPRPHPPPRNSRLSTIHTGLQPHQPGKRNNPHDPEPTQQNPTRNTPVHTHRPVH